MAHTMMSFGFDGDDYVCMSIETRKQKGQGYSAIKGLFRQFELTEEPLDGGVTLAFLFSCLNGHADVIIPVESETHHGVSHVRGSSIDHVQIRRAKFFKIEGLV